MEALTQCWYTREHLPGGARRRGGDGSVTGTCRYCHRRIVSWGGKNWSLADGLNVSRLAETSALRFLYVVDPADEYIVARYPVNHLEREDEIEAYGRELRERHGMNEPGSILQLRDSGAGRPKRRSRTQAETG